MTVVGDEVSLGAMVVVDQGLAGVEVRGREPFGTAVFADTRCPAALFDKAVVGPAGQHFLVDIGVAAVCPAALGVVDLATVAGHGAAVERAAAVAGMQHDPLSLRGGASAAS